jgi:Serine dehydrogenase proteinase
MTKKDAFPRGADLPTQSPLFWVQQKDRYLRQLMIGDIEAISGRRTVVYFANRYLDNSDINIGDISYLTEILGDLAGAPTDIILNTSGGQTDATEAIVSLLQASLIDFRIVVPHSAKSNGTMICLAAKEIVMGPPSELGPIDPALGGTPTSILAEDTVKQQNFALHMLALYAIAQTKSLATKLLTNGMMAGRPVEEIQATVQSLSSRDHYFSHGSTIDHVEAARLGLRVTFLNSDDPFWQRVWLLYCMYAHDVAKSGVVKVFEGRARSLSVSPPA